MFILSLKPNKKKILAYTLIFAITIISTTLIMGNNAITTGTKITNTKASNNKERIIFLEQFEWEVSKEPIEIVEVVIPNKFNDVYNEYNKIQKKQGFDLSKYKGKRVKRYTYQVTNYPSKTDDNTIRANIIIYNSEVIGGDICSIKLNGFMHGFKMQE